jgi:hypothetical protein
LPLFFKPGRVFEKWNRTTTVLFALRAETGRGWTFQRPVSVAPCKPDGKPNVIRTDPAHLDEDQYGALYNVMPE